MVRLKAKLSKGGLLEIVGLEQLIDSKLGEFKRALGLTAAKRPEVARATEYVRPVTAKAAAKQPAAKKAKAPRAPKAASANDAYDVVMATLAKHPLQKSLIKAGSQPDQLLRSLIPLYLAQESGVEVTSGTISRFWKKHGVKYAAPNAAKALRQHVGYARATKAGRQITPNGIKYVEAAVARKAA